jgi:hypothetical protein
VPKNASPTPGIRESARAVPTHTQTPPGCTTRPQWTWLRGRLLWPCYSTAVTAGFVRGHRAPVKTNNRRVHRDTHHRCTRMCKRPSLPPVPRSNCQLEPDQVGILSASPQGDSQPRRRFEGAPYGHYKLRTAVSVAGSCSPCWSPVRLCNITEYPTG